MTEEEPLFFSNRADWRAWLEHHHKTSTGVRLLYYNKSSGKPGLNHIDAVEEALCFGWIDSILKKIDADRFVLKYTPRKPRSVWSKINKEKAEALIAAGKMTAAGLQKIEEAQQQGVWEKAYTNKVKERLPSDLKQALLAHPRAWENFQQFANSYRNTYIGWVKGAKTQETRQRRITVVVQRSAQEKKPGID
ncbi:MAG: YdeI/OmpD-associated family protein [Candidatus Thermoplasmatota archaeon]|nr:YdeI/OmpD-associated family protein [Candidatus Thermoplasmatota archaeon]